MKQTLIAVLLVYVVSMNASAQKTITSWNKNQVIAHRGAWKKNKLPENSIASLKEAIRLKCFGSEFDVHLSLDSVLVVNHDPTFLGMAIAKSTYAQLLTKKLSNGESIPTLESYLKAGLKQQKTKLILELKPQKMGIERDEYMTEMALQMVRKLKAEAWVEYISFSFDICKYVVAHMPNAKVAYLNGDVAPAEVKAAGVTGLDYHYSAFQKNDWIWPAKQLGLTVNAWTINGVPEMEWLIANEVEFITTNEPELLFEVIKKAPIQNGWKLKWSDEFNQKGLPDPSKWTYDVGGTGWGNNEKQFYTDADSLNAKIVTGNLEITARKADREKMNFTSARLATRKKFDIKYGRIEVRAMLPKGRGLWPAIWMLPTDWKYGNWPKSGEIDIMEHVGYAPDTVHSTVHTQSFNHNINTQVGTKIFVKDLYTSYHIYACEWFEDRMDFFVDDQKIFSFKNSGKGTPEWPFDQQFHLLLNLAVGGNWGGSKGVDESIFPATMKVDYVRMFQK
jgi:beta-glucanase (GH16 family)/glycerophosphoryl diester phosphodiesterase